MLLEEIPEASNRYVLDKLSDKFKYTWNSNNYSSDEVSKLINTANNEFTMLQEIANTPKQAIAPKVQAEPVNTGEEVLEIKVIGTRVQFKSMFSDRDKFIWLNKGKTMQLTN